MVGTNSITPARKNDGRYNCRDVDDLDERKQDVLSKYRVAQKQDAGSKPN